MPSLNVLLLDRNLSGGFPKYGLHATCLKFLKSPYRRQTAVIIGDKVLLFP